MQILEELTLADRTDDHRQFPALRFSHTLVGIPWLIILMMGLSYGLMRWRSNSTAVTAVMHASYNLLIAIAMIFH